MSTKISEAHGMSHNLHFLRFVAAILVIMSHSFVLSTGDFEKEWFYRGSGGQITMGAFAVAIFFLYSGFLIARSFSKKPTVKEFLMGRCIRIFPVLIVTVMLSIGVLGPLFTGFSLKEYFSNAQTYKYMLNSIFLLQHNLPGVFEQNVYAATINGALWTLPVEFFCYILCLVLYKTGLLQKEKMWITIPIVIGGSIGICIVASKTGIEMLTTILFPMICFYMGILYEVYKEMIILDSKIFVASIVLFGIASVCGFLKVGFVLFLNYSLIYFAFGCKDMCKRVWKSGNWSYAMYLCGFPIQQAIISIYGGEMNPYMNILISIPIIIVVSIILYGFVEKKVTELYKIKENK